MVALLFILLASLGLTGIINRTRAWFSGRKGYRFFQHLYNVRVLLRKGAVYSTTTGAVFKMAPLVNLAAIATAALFVPLGHFPALLHFEGDFVVFVYLLGLARLAMVLGALDTGSSFEDMGASREALYGALVEPALFFVAGTLALMTGFTGFSSMFDALGAGTVEMAIVTLLLGYILIKIILIETGHIPIDDPRTHLELTMIHEGMILDYGGIDLAFLQIANWLKTAVLATLAGGIIASAAAPVRDYLSIPMIFCIVTLIGLYVGLLESFRARNSLSKNSMYIISTVFLSLFGFLLVYILNLNLHIQ